MIDLANLNKEQKRAVDHKDGPVLIVAGAGTGKTMAITYRIAALIEKGLAKPEEILALTFTDKAAGEMEERIDRLLPYGYVDLWVSTFHSFCERILKDHGLDIGLPTDFKLLDQTASWLLVRQNIDKFKLNYYKPLGNPTKFVHSLVSHFSRCKDQAISPGDYLNYSKSVSGEDKNRIREIAEAYQKYQELLLENGLLDFGDLINYCLKLFQKRPLILKKYRKQFKYILVDEFQDTNWVQYELVKLLASPKNNLMVCADDDQCLPGDSKIDFFEGGKIISKKIKNINAGDKVLTAVGKGHIGVASVDNVFINNKEAQILTVKTENGYSINITDNHKMFCCVPRTARQGYHYVYLMFRKNLGWRIGTTDDLIMRLKLERSADKILAVRAFNSDTEARYYETLWSLKYGIPTNCFKNRKGTVIKDSWVVKLYKEIDVANNVQKLSQDLNIDLDSPHYCLDAVKRGRSARIIINLQMCYRKYRSKEHVKNKKRLLLNGWINHRLYLETSDRETIKKLKIAGYNLTKVKKGSRLNIESTDLQKLEKEARVIEKITGGFIEYKFNAASKYYKPTSNVRNFMSLIIPAKNLVLGHYLPVKRENEIIYDRIVSIKRVEKKIKVYDLEIKGTYNFIANGVVVHNSIYRWRGASFTNVIQFRKDYPKAKEIVLIKNYRSTQDILDLAYGFIQSNNPNRLEYINGINKNLLASKKGKGIIKHLHFRTLEGEVQGTINKIIKILKRNKEAKFNDFAILVRANDAANAFLRACERAGIPYQFMALRGLYSKPIILDIISYFKLLDNYHESSAVYRILNLPFLKISADDVAKITQYSYKKFQSIYETLQEISLINGLSDHTVGSINKILSLIKKHTELALEKNVSEVLVSFLEDSGYMKYLAKREKREDLDFIDQFYSKIKTFEETSLDPKLRNFMEELNLELESGEEGKLNFDPEQGPDMVRIMTIHAAKGLEFKYVFLINLVDRRFPTTERKEPIEIDDELIKDIIPEGDAHLEEERRLFYVGMTRAKEGLFFTSAEDYGSMRKKKLSRFLTELGYDMEIKETKEAQAKAVKVKKRKEKVKIVLPNYFSFTQLAAFEKCPLQYKFAHILKIPIRGKAVFSFGKTMHNTLFEFVKAFSEGGADFEKMFRIYREKWIDEWYKDKKQKSDYFKLGKKILQKFYDDFSKQKPSILYINNAPALEQGFNSKIGGYTINGKIDRIDKTSGGVEIIDYKTGSMKEKLRIEDKQQLLIYQIAVEEVFGLKPERLTYYYLEDGKKVSFLGSESDKKRQKEKVVSQIEQIKKSNFAPTPGWQCEWCDFKDICEYSSY